MQYLLRDPALVGPVQVEELSLDVGHAVHSGDAQVEAGFIASEFMADKLPLQLLRKFPACLPVRLGLKS